MGDVNDEVVAAVAAIGTADSAAHCAIQLIGHGIEHRIINIDVNHLRPVFNLFAGNSKRFPAYQLLEQTNKRLSRLDSSYKPLWDSYSAQPNP